MDAKSTKRLSMRCGRIGCCAILMNGGPGTVHAPRALEAFREFAQK